MVYRDEILRALHCGELPPDMCDSLAEPDDARVVPPLMTVAELANEIPAEPSMDTPSLVEAR